MLLIGHQMLFFGHQMVIDPKSLYQTEEALNASVRLAKPGAPIVTTVRFAYNADMYGES